MTVMLLLVSFTPSVARSKNMVLFGVSHGVGGGVIINRKLFTEAVGSNAGENRHILQPVGEENVFQLFVAYWINWRHQD
ncbi:hypothetical protein O9992_27180 [Vibrio lentus]|nr:hypothetical protein [Vibrio lentus]